MKSGFTRQETLQLTGITSNQLSYLDRTDVVKPEKSGNLKHPKVIYSWEQVLQIKTISRLRESLSLQEIRQVIDYLKRENYNPSLFKMGLLFFNSNLYWVKDEDELKSIVIELTGKNRGQIIIHSVQEIGNVIDELRREAERNQVLDFDKRIQGTPLAIS
ncbi:MerR family transcriptional regulator [Trichocoleus desertorum AS-A10]|uniref:MerR family transcriptional regulator n=1 Tax=Trichocoleus desertorum TaxID=1481672 RepID=UPI0032996A1F